jgi:hypothetical protein
MKNFSTAIILEDLIPLTITNLNALFNLSRLGNRTRVMNIYESGPIDTFMIASLLITLNIEIRDDFIILEFDINNQTVKQHINLFCQLSSFGKGYWYYFKCPITGEKCKKLYYWEQKFVSRAAIPGVLYKRQIESKSFRNAIKDNRKINSSYKIICKGFKPYAKPYYRAKSTKTKRRMEKAQAILKKFR